MTEHFEDFDAAKLTRYICDAQEVTHKSGFFIIPGVEVHLAGLDTILFPVRSYDDVASFAATGRDSEASMFKVLAHPSKYPFEMVEKHLEAYEINGIELWNQQENGRYIPPVDFLGSLRAHPRRNQYRYFFGCDLHNVNLTIANVLSLPVSECLTADAIVNMLVRGDFVSLNLSTGIEYCNGSERNDFDRWLQTLHERSYVRGKLFRHVRRTLKACYRMLPRDAQHSLNDFKNFVRNKV